jgi:hypothetical protein
MRNTQTLFLLMVIALGGLVLSCSGEEGRPWRNSEHWVPPMPPVALKNFGICGFLKPMLRNKNGGVC